MEDIQKLKELMKWISIVSVLSDSYKCYHNSLAKKRVTKKTIKRVINEVTDFLDDKHQIIFDLSKKHFKN